MNIVKIISTCFLFSFLITGCNTKNNPEEIKSSQELLELEMKQKEIELKEKELALKEKEYQDKREKDIEERERKVREKEIALQKNRETITRSQTSAGVPGLFPQASTRKLSGTELSNLNKSELRLMRNEIFARYGYKFKTPEMKNYFMKTSWYTPLYDNVDKMLTATEKANVELILRYEKNFGNYNYEYSR